VSSEHGRGDMAVAQNKPGQNIHTRVQVSQWMVDTSPFPSSPCRALAMRASVALHARANLRMAAAHGDQQHAHRAG
jgi:hypothetical protein